MKRKILSMVVPALLAAGVANAAEVYNKDSNKLDLYGKVDGRHQFSKDTGNDGDESYVRIGFQGETQVTDGVTGYGQWEYNVQVNHAESAGPEGNATRLGFAGLKFAGTDSVDYGRNYGVLYDIGGWTDQLPIFGDDTYEYADVYMTGRTNGVATYRNTGLFGLAEGLSLALQYQGKNENDRELDSLTEQNGDGFGVSTIYQSDIGLSIGGAYSNSNRTLQQKNAVIPGFARGDKAEAWTVGAKYDANNVYLAAMYAVTLNMTPYGGDDLIADTTENIEVVAQYQFDFGLRPSLAYLQSKGKDLGVPAADGTIVKDADLVKYVDVGAYYDFNKNITAYVDYKINLLDDKAAGFAKTNGIGTDDIVGVGLVYQF